MDRYETCIRQWDNIFAEKPPSFPESPESGIPELDRGLQWLIQGAESVLDFGCGNGTLLFLCSRYGTREHIGIDLSGQAVRNAEAASRRAEKGTFRFFRGSTERLKALGDAAMDAAILSNILDNLYPEDAKQVLAEVRRILKPGGRLLVKLNPCLTPEQIRAWGIRTVCGNLLDDGMLLWNNTGAQWESLLSEGFTIRDRREVRYGETDRADRLFLLVREQ